MPCFQPDAEDSQNQCPAEMTRRMKKMEIKMKMKMRMMLQGRQAPGKMLKSRIAMMMRSWSLMKFS